MLSCSMRTATREPTAELKLQRLLGGNNQMREPKSAQKRILNWQPKGQHLGIWGTHLLPEEWLPATRGIRRGKPSSLRQVAGSSRNA